MYTYTMIHHPSTPINRESADATLASVSDTVEIDDRLAREYHLPTRTCTASIGTYLKILYVSKIAN